MPTAPTAHATITGTAVADISLAGTRVFAPTAWFDGDDPFIDVYVTDIYGNRVALLPTARLGAPSFPLSADAQATVTYQADDPNAWALRLPDGRVANSETSSLEIQIFRRGALLPAHWCITKADPDPATGTVTLSLADTTWYLQQRRLGTPQLKNYLDLAHWDGESPLDGWFDSALSGWGTIGGASMEAVEDPGHMGAPPSLDVFAPWSAKVTAPGSPVATGMGIFKQCDVSHNYAPGLPYRFQARNWHPHDQPEFYFETPLRLFYSPPGFSVPQPAPANPFQPGTHKRDTWTTFTADIHIPPNEGGRLLCVMESPESGYTYWGSRWAVIRDETFTANDYTNGDLPAVGAAKVVNVGLSLPSEPQYRNLHADASSPAGRRVHYRYPAVEHHSPYDVLQKICNDGAVTWWWDVTPNRRTLVAGTRAVVRWDWPITLDDPSGFVQKWSNDASQAHNRVIAQSAQTEFSRDQQAVVANDRPGATVDYVYTATTQQNPASLYMLALDVLSWRRHSPDLVTAWLAGDAIHQVHVGDFHPVGNVDIGGYSLDTPLLRSVSLRYLPDVDRVELQMAPWVPPGA